MKEMILTQILSSESSLYQARSPPYSLQNMRILHNRIKSKSETTSSIRCLHPPLKCDLKILWSSAKRHGSAVQMRFLILGLDEGFNRSKPGYTDTIMLVSVSLLRGNLRMMSIPRDLWIPISDREEDRIGVVYTAAETKGIGKGPDAVTTLVRKSFQIPVHYYVLVKMQGFIDIVDSLDGVDIVLSRPVARYPAGVTRLDGRAALAFARDRAETDDFARMVQAQILIKAILTQALKVETWSRFPRALHVLRGAAESNIPFWAWPRLALMVLQSHLNGTESYTITRDMVCPRITSQGEQVIEPDWDKIRAMTRTIFNK